MKIIYTKFENWFDRFQNNEDLVKSQTEKIEKVILIKNAKYYYKRFLFTDLFF